MQELSEIIRPRPKAAPTIYAYSDERFEGLLKVGFTTRKVEERMKEHYPTLLPKKTWKIEYEESAMKNDGTFFDDHAVHAMLEKHGIKRIKIENEKSEWFSCDVRQLQNAVLCVKQGRDLEKSRTQDFKMRPEQNAAVEKTFLYFNSIKNENRAAKPKFLWNCKMRFGKTFACYKLAQKMRFKKILILTFKPAVQSAWKADVETHIDFENWQFICNPHSPSLPQINEQYEKANKENPIVCFGSFQDFLQKNLTGGIKAKNEWVHTTNWDLVVFDEYHFGAWRENAKKLFEAEDEEAEFLEEEYHKNEEANALDETFLPITSEHYLFLSGTPFRALENGDFIEEAIFSWTYSDEQNAKANWEKNHNSSEKNPYAALPKMTLFTYRVPEDINQVALKGEFNEFDLNEFFEASGTGDFAFFKYESDVQKWLDLIRGSHLPSSIDDLKLGKNKRPPMPFSDQTLLHELCHTLWFLPSVSSCFAMKNLLKKNANKFFCDYRVVVCAGSDAGIGAQALPPVLEAMENPLETKTITLTCGKLTTGVTVKPWTGIFMLRNLTSPETYFQAAFRVQSPWEIKNEMGESVILKNDCYVFDFALDRALQEISDYSRRLNPSEQNPEKLVADFISFLPVLAYDGSTMKQINAQEILDIATSGTSATLLARRWESALLVNVDDTTLKRLLDNKEAFEALMKIEGFRKMKKNVLELIINKSHTIKKAKALGIPATTEEEKREFLEEEKKMKSLRKQVQENLMKFATRIPIFMYLTDFRENTLKEVVSQIEPELFKKVTALSKDDFDKLVSIGVFNSSLMNDAIFKFRRYEDSSLFYTGLDMHHYEKNVGGFDTTLSKNEFSHLYYK